MKFIARKHKGLRIVLDPRIRIKNMGRSTTQSLTGDTQLGLTVEFVDGIFETDDKKTIEFLQNHPAYGYDFISDEKKKFVPTVQAAREANEKAEFAEQLRSKCPECGKEFANETALNGHMRVHNK